MDEFEQLFDEFYTERMEREYYSRPVREYLADCEAHGMRSRSLALKCEVLG